MSVQIARNKGVVQARETRETLMTSLMYLYQAYRNQGFDEKEAKEAVAEEIADLLAQWQTLTGLSFHVSAAVNPLKLLDDLITTTRNEAERAPTAAARAAWQRVHRQLIDLKAMAKKVPEA
ncbi:MAG TPA: hypothetical protein VIL07_11400 [Symbiobacteriaceae bacterium]